MKRRTLTLLVLGGAIVLLAAAAGLVAWHPWTLAAEAAAAKAAQGAAAGDITAMAQSVNQAAVQAGRIYEAAAPSPGRWGAVAAAGAGAVAGAAASKRIRMEKPSSVGMICI